MALTFSLITSDGKLRQDPAAVLLAGDFPRFLSGVGLSGVRVTLPAAQPLPVLRVYFLGTTVTYPWDSWASPPRVPERGALTLQRLSDADSLAGPALPCTETRALWRSHPDLPFPDGAVIELRPQDPGAVLQHLALRLPPGNACLLRIEALPASEPPLSGDPLDAPICRELPYYPASRTIVPRSEDPLAELLTAKGEPSLEQLWRVALPFLGTAMLGVLEGPVASAAWDGGVAFPAAYPDPSTAGPFQRHYLRLDLGALTAPQSFVSQRLYRGWQPIHEARARAGDLRLLQTSFVDLSGRLRQRWLVENLGAQPVTLQPRLRATHSRAITAAGPSWPELPKPPERCRASHHEPLPIGLQARGEGCELRLGDRVGRFSHSRALTVPAGGVAALELELPLQAPMTDTGTFEQALHGTEAYWDTYLQSGAQLQLPDSHFQDLWRALHVHNRLFQSEGKMRYGHFPGVYQGQIFGIEEGWNLTALAMLGQGEIAQRLLASTFFEAEFLKKEGQHHQYRNGLCIVYLWEIYQLTHDQQLLRALYPSVVESARWIIDRLRSTRTEEQGERPPHFGLMPKHTYGGDLSHPAYSLYGSSACWRGLRDAALVAKALGQSADATEFANEAALARRHMHEAAARIFKHSGKPPFLPFQVDEPGDEPEARDYHQLFASMLLETALFGWNGRFARSITDYLQQTGRLVVGTARFDQWYDRLGIDAEYTRGVQLAHLCRRDFDRFWLGVVGQVGLSCDPATFTSPETSIVRFSSQDYQERMRALAWDPRRLDSDPCSAGTAVMLQYLRYLLCFEERDEDDLTTGALWLAPGAPRAWFAPGKKFGVSALPTAMGPLSLEVSSQEDEVLVRVTLAQPTLCEVFYYDRAGQRRSQRRGLSGQTELRLPR